MSALKSALESGKFAVTAEMAPPRGCDCAEQMSAAELLRGKVHAINVTDMPSASLRASSLGLCIKLKQAGLEPIFQMTGRDRSRLAIMGDMLSAASFGIDTVLALTGDHTMLGDCKASKPVYDLDSVGILRMLSTMEATGLDFGGNPLTATPSFFKGAVVTPSYEPLQLQINKLRQKVDAGAEYIQTQAVFDRDTLRRLMDAIDHAGIRAHVIAGVIPLRSTGMARYMNNKVPGIIVPEPLIGRLEAAEAEGCVRGIRGLPARLGLELVAELVAWIRSEGLCHGVHIMTVGAEKSVPEILEKAGVTVE